MQCLALQAERRAPAVQLVSDQRVPARRQVHADLVRAPGVQRAVQRRWPPRRGPGRSTSVRAGLPPRDHGHAHALLRIAPDRRVDACSVGQRRHAVDQRQVRALHLARGDRPHQRGHRGAASCATTIRPLVSLSSRCTMPARGSCAAARVMRQQAVEQGARPVARRRMHHQPGRLVDAPADARPRARCPAPSAAAVKARLCAVGHSSTCTRWPARTVRDALVGGHAVERARAPRSISVLQMAARELAAPARPAPCRGAARAAPAIEQPLAPLGLERVGLVRRVVVAVERVGRRGIGPACVIRIALMPCPSTARREWPSSNERLLRLPPDRPCCVALLAGVLAGCSSTPKDDEHATAPKNCTQTPRDDMARGQLRPRHQDAARSVEGRAAGTLLAQQAQLDLAYALLEDRRARAGASRRSTASSSCTRRARRSTTRCTCAAWSTSTTTSACSAHLARQDLSERDQQASRDAYQSFKQLVDQFPSSKYSADARAAHGLHRQRAGAVRSARGALLLPPRRLRGGGQPRAAGGARVTSRRRRSKRRCTSWCSSYDKLGLDAAARRRRPRAEAELPRQPLPDATACAAATRPWWQFW